ncbi:Acyl-CoA N-acyltransferase [Cordyceps militaris CM01]|uniref:Acyl-CoA N-acyltransferase n=1 Tax=Cordyceps militaris (strain CM01) TaxID=983644 RepID=G3J394_CORMM|nr:Acyl-CoA N-acyltransferase [Cordyceps militaris CM01]EGX96475.1 Acyl-CoA N-acyltransferase [Cordyceps militaris CM01]
MYCDIPTSRLLLRPVQTNEEGSIDLERFHTLWSNEQATKWRSVHHLASNSYLLAFSLTFPGSKRGPCRTLAESKAWMANIVPMPMPTNNLCVSYFVLYAEGDGGFVHPVNVDEKDWKMAGIVTLLPTDCKLADESLTYARGAEGDPYKVLELGFLFMPEVWGNGFATESVRAVIHVYRRDVQPTNALFPREILALVHEKNAGSRRVLQKAGFNEVHQSEAIEWLPLVDDSKTQKHTVVHFRMAD